MKSAKPKVKAVLVLSYVCFKGPKQIFIRVVLPFCKLLAGSIKILFLAPARPNSRALVPCYTPGSCKDTVFDLGTLC